MKKIIAVVCASLVVAAVCLAGMTLAFCAADDPRLFYAVTGAASQSLSGAVSSLGEGARDAASSVGSAFRGAAQSAEAYFDRATVLEPVPGLRVQTLQPRPAPPGPVK